MRGIALAAAILGCSSSHHAGVVDAGAAPPADAAAPLADAGSLPSRDAPRDPPVDAPLDRAVDTAPDAAVDRASDTATLAGFRPMLPLSTSVLSARSPTFRWSDVDLADYFMLELCRDPRCELVTNSFASGLTSYTIETPLPPGVQFWRARAHLVQGQFLASAVWETFVGQRGAPRDATLLALPDLDRDGRADVALAGEGGPVDVSLWGVAAVPLPALALAGPTRALAYGVDVNGDGFGDLLVGRDAAVDVYHGRPAGPSGAVTLRGEPGFGAALAGLGDVDGDGFGDVLVGARASASLFLGGQAGLVAPARATLPFSRFAASGDVNADGYADAITCAPTAAGAPGRAVLHFGSPRGLEQPRTLDDPRGPGQPAFGNACRAAGDVDGDGFADVVVTAADVVIIYYGGEGPARRAPAVLRVDPGPSPDDHDAAAAGDVNRDGYGDVVVASPTGLRLFLGGAAGLTTTPASTLAGSFRAAAPLGDVDRDGYGEVLAVPATCGQSPQIFSGTEAGLGPPLYTFPAAAAPCPRLLLAR